MRLENLNPSVKAATVLLCAVLLAFQYQVALSLTVFFTALLLLTFFSRARWGRIAALLTPALAAAFGLFMMGLYYARGSGAPDLVELSDLDRLSALPYAVRAAMSRNLLAASQLASRLLAYAGLGMAFALSTDPEDFVASLMAQCRLPPKFAYGTLAALHLMPNMVREFRTVRTAFAVRGIRVGPLSPKPLFTMLVNSVLWSECVAMAMESKGFEGGTERTRYLVPRVRWFDVLFCALCVGGVALGMWLGA